VNVSRTVWRKPISYRMVTTVSWKPQESAKGFRSGDSGVAGGGIDLS